MWQKLAARAGIEPVSGFLEALVKAVTCENGGDAVAHGLAQKLAELTEVLSNWPRLAPEMRAAILTMARTARKEGA